MTTQDTYLAECFPEPPLIAYKRQRNIRDLLIKAKVFPIPRAYPKRQINGMKKCGRQCVICSYIMEGNTIKTNQFSWKIKKNLNCLTHNIVYMIQCEKSNCKLRYIAESERKLQDRISEHIGYIRTKKLNKATGEHFNLPGHSLADMKATIIEKVKSPDTLYRKERERYHINKFNTYHQGINKKP